MIRKNLSAAASLLFSALYAAAAAGVDKIDIVKDGKSDYQIVVPSVVQNPNIGSFLRTAARLLQSCVKDSTGAELPIVEEGALDRGRPAFFLGDTEFAKQNGVETEKLPGWTYIEKAAGKNIILAGNDRPCRPSVTGSDYTDYILGTMKAVTEFLHDEAGVRFVLPGPNGVAVPLSKNLAAPADLSIKKEPFLKFSSGRGAEMIYGIANNYLPAGNVKLYGGHSYYSAVPKDKFRDSNPEYFALIGGKRNPADNHLCISNPKVQEMIYQEMLASLDKGYEAVELGQTDGYTECECENCRKLFGVTDPGEKLWTLHKNLTERLQKDRPGKKVIIISYGPTSSPPKTFTEFPPNVMIELCGYTPEKFGEWRKHTVPQGFMTYVYNWGNYQAVGMTAKRTPHFCSEQAELFMGNNVRAVYKCGFGELYGMEGPAYYVYGRSFSAPDNPISAETLADEYYRAAYGETYLPMKKFFDTLHGRLELFASAIDGPLRGRLKMPAVNPRALLAYNYSPDILETMETCLQRAEKTASDGKVKKRLALVRREFDYTKNLASIIHLHNAYKIKPDWSSFDRLAELILKRNEMIASYYDEKGAFRSSPEWPVVSFMGNISKDMLTVNGRLTAPINSPLTWDVKRLKESKTLPGTSGKKLTVHKAKPPVRLNDTFDSGAWKGTPSEDINELQMGTVTQKTRMKALYDDSALWLAFECGIPDPGMKFTPAGQDGPAWRQECVEIFLDPFAKKEINYHLIYNPVENSRYDAVSSTLIDPLDPRYDKDDPSWNGGWDYKTSIDKEGKKWLSTVRIPFSALKAEKPQAGTVWLGNFGRERHQGPEKIEYHLWSPNLETINFCDPEAFGEIIFAGD